MSSIEAMEEKLAYLEKTVDDLSTVVARQDRELTRLTRLLEMLAQREAEREMDTGGTIPLADQKPPHW